MKHIGIVACSAEGAALCYRTICEGGDHPQVSMHGHSLAEYMRCIDRDDWDAVGDLMLSSAEKLAAAGADFLICPDNTIHRAFDYVRPRSPLPWLHIARVVGEDAQRRGYRNVGVLGTRFTMHGPVYRDTFASMGIETIVPEGDDAESVDRIIFSELVDGVFTDASRTHYYEVIARLRERGCDAVALACTEIPLLVRPEESPLPTLDSTRLLAAAALRESLGIAAKR